MPTDHPSRAHGARVSPIAIAIALLVLVPTVGAAATYHVAPGGSDAAAGSAGAPWRTFAHAVSVAQPGDTVLIADGTYAERLLPTRSGTATAPITFANEPAQSPIIDGTTLGGGPYSSLIEFSSVSWIRVTGLAARNGAGHAVGIDGNATHIEVTGCELSNSQSGVWIEGPTSPAYTIIRGCHVHDNALGGITLWNSTGGYYLIESNLVHDNQGNGNYDGIQVGGADGASHHVVVRNNTVYANGAANAGADQIDMGGHVQGHHYLVDGNDVQGPGGSVKVQGTNPYALIARHNRLTGRGFITYAFPNPAVYYNNTVVGAYHDFLFWTDNPAPLPGLSFNGLEVRNNVFAGADSYVFTLGGVTGFNIDVRRSSLFFDGNLYKFTTKGIGWVPRIFDCAQPDPLGQTEFVAYQTANTPDLQDPHSHRTTAGLGALFVDPANRDYHLAAGSPAIDAGTDLTRTTNAGTNSTVVKVVKAWFFQDGYAGLIDADSVKIGSNAPVKIQAVDELNNTITLTSPLSWNVNDPVNLPYTGTAPDAGAFEADAAPRRPTAPVLLTVQPLG